MFTRSLGGLAACVGVAASAAAQQPAASLGRPQQTMTQAGYAAQQGTGPGVYQVGGQAAPGTPSYSAAAFRSTAPGGYAQAAASPPAAAPAPGAFPTNSAPAMMAPVSGYPAGQGMPGACGPTGCDTGACNACDCLCGPPGRVWVSAEYLYWVGRGQNIPPLATSAPAGTPQAQAGALGAAGTGVLFGGGKYNDDWRSGFRFNAGTWLDDAQTFGIEGNFFFLGTSHDSFAYGSDGSQIITRPFFNALTGVQDTQLVSYPNVLAGTVTGDSTSHLIGGGGNFVRNLCCDPCGRFDLTLGYRYINLTDDVRINENLTALAGSNVPAGTRFLITDHFRTSNSFHGVPIGFNWERRFSHWFFGVRGSVALGVVHTEATVDGSTTIISPTGASQTYPGGLLTQPSNIGRYTDNHFAVVPEVGARVGAQVTDRLRAFVGYNFLYMSNVARAGDQIDTRVNTNQIAPGQNPLTGPALPAFNLNRTGYWVQGISFGVEYRF